MLGYFDGTCIIPLDFSIHKEKKLERKKAKQQYKKKVGKDTQGAKRRQEASSSKIDNALAMIRRAVKHGFVADYVLVDSWFTSLKFVQEVRKIKKGAMHVVAGMRNDKRKYTVGGESLNGKEIIRKLKAEGKEKRNRSWNVRYYDLVVHYEGVGDVKLFICRYPFRKKWRIFISTDAGMSFVEMMKTYGIRWSTLYEPCCYTKFSGRNPLRCYIST